MSYKPSLGQSLKAVPNEHSFKSVPNDYVPNG